MNLFEQFDDIITEEVAGKIASVSNDTSNNALKSLKGIYYTLVAGLIRRGNSTMSSNMLFNQIERNGKKGELVANMSSYITNKNKFELLTHEGNKLLSQVFPAFKSPLISMVGTYADTPKPAAVAYSGLLASFLVDLLDEKIVNEKLNTDSFTEFLRQHHLPLLNDSPEGLLEVMIPALGLQELRNVKSYSSKRQTATTPTRNEEEEENASSTYDSEPNYDDLSPKKPFSVVAILGIAVALVGIGVFAWWYFTQREAKVEETAVATEVVEEPQVVKDTTLAVVDSTAIQLAAGAESEYTSFGQGLMTYLNDSSAVAGKVFPIDQVQFLNGTTTLDPSSMLIIDELSEIISGNSQIQIRIMGYDVSGNNTTASKRAYAIKRELLNRGGDNNRIDAGGTTTPGKNAVSVKIISK